MSKAVIPIERIASAILMLRDQRVMLDYDLAVLYGLETRALKQAVRRNPDHFPNDFMFELSEQAIDTVVSQFVIPDRRRFGGAKPMAFTEQGIAMLSSVLNNERAIKVNIAIMRAFVKLRETLETNRELARKFSELEQRVGKHDQGNRCDYGSDATVDGAAEKTGTGDRISCSREGDAVSGA